MEVINDQRQEVSTMDWFITIFITAIPLVGFIMLFVWAFGSNTLPSKANWARATLLWFVLGIIIYGLIAVVFGIAFLGSSMAE